MISKYRTNPSSSYIEDIRPIFPQRPYAAPQQPRDPHLYAAMLPARHAQAYSSTPIGELARTHEAGSCLDTSSSDGEDVGPAYVQPRVEPAPAHRSVTAQLLHVAHSHAVKAGAIVIIVLAAGALTANFVAPSQDTILPDTSNPNTLSDMGGRPATTHPAAPSTSSKTSGQPVSNTTGSTPLAYNGAVSISQSEPNQPGHNEGLATSALNSISTNPSALGIHGSTSLGEPSNSVDQSISPSDLDKDIDQGTKQTASATVPPPNDTGQEENKKPSLLPILGGVLDKLGL